MTNYAAKAEKAVKKFDTADELEKGAAPIAGKARSFVKDAGENAEEMAEKGAKFLKNVENEGRKDLRKARDFIKEHPVKGAAYAVGLGALLTYFLFPRK